jgi:phosphoribosyl 1,2-cyclic phosphate phosphodiesterase
MGLEQALEVVDRLQPEKTYLTHMSHEFDYETLNPKLPGGVEMAYDGLRFMF